MVHSEEIKALELLRNEKNLKACIELFRDFFIQYEELESTISDQEIFLMAIFWNSYLSMVQTLRDFVKSIKLRDWDLHVH